MAENPPTPIGASQKTARREEPISNGVARVQTGPDIDLPDGALKDEPETGAKKGVPWGRVILFVAIATALFVGIPWGLSYWHFASTHVSTDDAYVVGNLVNVSPVVNGTLKELLVDEGTYVRKGQLIARLKSAARQSTVRQARATYVAALSQIPQAERNLLFQQEATDAAIRKAKSALGSQLAKTRGAEQQLTLTSSTTRSQIRQAESQLVSAQALRQQSAAQAYAADTVVDIDQQAVQTALASQDTFQQQVVTAQKALQAAQARVQAAQSEADRTAKDETRYRVLYTQDAVSAQVYDNARAQAKNASANLQASQSQADEAQSQVNQAKSAVRQAQSQVEQARKSVTQAQAQAAAAHRGEAAAAEQVAVARSGVNVAHANSGQVGVQRANVASTAAQTGESQADIENAHAGQQQVEVRRRQIATYRAQAEQARAALNNAEIELGDTKIYAPHDGTIVKKVANIGSILSPGQTIVTMTQGDYVWVEANFKETQLKGVEPGESAEIEVDAIPGKIFKGRVQSINQVTGAATSLLPPDNATGNFTKVVQRLPVRIEFVPATDRDASKYARQKDLANVRQGMSVTATIATTAGRSGDKSARIRSEGRAGVAAVTALTLPRSSHTARYAYVPTDGAAAGLSGGSGVAK